ncbi:MAG: hypothetical protein JNJ83_21385 [Verrucomicrobiaceae bacterium]|nr:hypothetical protein [Verrucomicrobiaceae bacterium]
MKNSSRLLCLVTALGTILATNSVLQAQLPVSLTEGVMAIPVPPAAVTQLGLPFTRTPVARATITSASGLAITVAGAPFTAGALITTPHSAVLLGGTNDGLSYRITANTTNGLTLATSVPSGITPNSVEVLVVPDWTLGTLFGTTGAQVGQLLNVGATVAAADKVAVDDGASVTEYFFNSAAGGWRRADGTLPAVDQAGVRIANQRGVVINRIAGGPNVDLVISGKVRSGTQRIVTRPGATAIVSNVFTSTLTLNNSGIRLAVRANATPNGADKVTIENGGTATTYYLSNNGWRLADGSPGDQGGVQILPGKAVKIERGGAPPVYPSGWAPGRPKRHFQPVTPPPALTWKVLQPFAS